MTQPTEPSKSTAFEQFKKDLEQQRARKKLKKKPKVTKRLPGHNKMPASQHRLAPAPIDPYANRRQEIYERNKRLTEESQRYDIEKHRERQKQ